MDQGLEYTNRVINTIRGELFHKIYNSRSFPFFLIQSIETEENKYYIFFSLDLLITDGMSVLQRWSTNKQFTIKMTTFKRPRQEAYLSVIGDFTSTSLIKTDIDTNASLKENVQKLQRTINESFRYSAFEGVEVLSELSKRSNHSNSMRFVFTSIVV